MTEPARFGEVWAPRECRSPSPCSHRLPHWTASPTRSPLSQSLTLALGWHVYKAAHWTASPTRWPVSQCLQHRPPSACSRRLPHWTASPTRSPLSQSLALALGWHVSSPGHWTASPTRWLVYLVPPKSLSAGLPAPSSSLDCQSSALAALAIPR